ncbi:hypothetical protein QA312_02645 [Glaesserella parasuis]|uniref:hypothetical protein n=2 Tax=Glaesserella parasuis TaxID=738 RepID=UPI000A88D0D3|nr:hypothetical protein [Glaesserella parasuis]MDG6303686.1 hypothetical protein [Glaesserella parasuis]MDG6352296.1 hypothetical protein [Glaesserella parasuis]MDG6464504.1 hypothetical protein [Glaesserella parasuis]MDG6468904.1 hypothetical protein [Glaesserella parasuis]MDG6822849.1 hypothetical protein [Glaesserella parasuis]
MMVENTPFPQNDYFEQLYAMAKITGFAEAGWDPLNDVIAIKATTPGELFPFAITEQAAKELVVVLQYLLENKTELTPQ